MTREQFAAWRARMGWSAREAGEALGVTLRQVYRYETGETHPIPVSIALACEALEARRKRARKH